MSNKVADAALDVLGRERPAIEAEIGEPLQWNPYPDKRDKVIMLSRSADLTDRSSWPGYCNWLAERVDKFRKVFGPRIRAMEFEPKPSELASTLTGPHRQCGSRSRSPSAPVRPAFL